MRGRREARSDWVRSRALEPGVEKLCELEKALGPILEFAEAPSDCPLEMETIVAEQNISVDSADSNGVSRAERAARVRFNWCAKSMWGWCSTPDPLRDVMLAELWEGGGECGEMELPSPAPQLDPCFSPA